MRRMALMWDPESERLTDAEVETEPARLRLAVDEQAGNRVQLVADVGPDRPDLGVVAEPRADVVAQIVEVEVPRLRPDVAAIEEEHRPEVPPHRHADLGREVHEAVATDREPRPGEGRDVLASPAAQVGCAAEEVTLVEGDADLDGGELVAGHRAADRIDRTGSGTDGEHGRPDGAIGAALAGDLVVVVVP